MFSSSSSSSFVATLACSCSLHAWKEEGEGNGGYLPEIAAGQNSDNTMLISCICNIHVYGRSFVLAIELLYYLYNYIITSWILEKINIYSR